jgi:hypothetical protein
MAGAGNKLFTSGSVLTANDVNTYLMDQSIMRFTSTTTRDAAFGGAGEPTLAEGMFAYTTDTNTLWLYNGSSWVNLLGSDIGEQALSNRNLIINGAMQIDQRNSGASYTAVNATYGLDRWGVFSSAATKFSVQRLTTTPPVGFGYYQRFTSLAATADTAGAYYNFYQIIEGFNATKLAWGTANAKSVSLSFWVRSSLTGTFGGALRNAGSGGYYSYAFTYTINSANTWEYKTISITGSTAGTWGSTNDVGVNLFFDLGCNSAETQAAGSWQNANKLGANGCVRLIGTNAATLDVTGIQFEVGAVATPFEFEDIGVTLAKCQRYYEKSYNQGVNPATDTTDGMSGIFLALTSGAAANIGTSAFYKVTKRANPTVTAYSKVGTAGNFSNSLGSGDVASTVLVLSGQTGFVFYNTTTVTSTISIHWVASAEL